MSIDDAVARVEVYDIHTHLYTPALGDLLLWGIDEMLVYHYLVAEGFRYLEMPYETFWKLDRREQADLLWDQLFLRHSPISEACRGVLTVLNRLGLDVRRRDLDSIRKWYAGQTRDNFITLTMETARVGRLCMTNSPFDDRERVAWEKGVARDPRFAATLRIDPLLVDWPGVSRRLARWGYGVTSHCAPRTISEVRRFLVDWTKRLNPLYVMVGLPPEFTWPSSTPTATLIESAVLPHCRDHGLPFAIMPGARKRINPGLRLAGDGVGAADMPSYQRLIAAHPKNKFLLSVLSRENQFELCVLARKFRNLHVFGCWWFNNVPTLIEEITRLRLELVGLGVTAQHSDARVLDQIIYKWDHSRKIIAGVLKDKYRDLAATGWEPTGAEIERDVRDLFGGSFEQFLKMSFA